MHFLDKTISVNGTEKDFFKKLIAEVTAADDRISCDTDLDTEFSKESDKPQIIFNLLNVCTLTFTRGQQLSSQSKDYSIELSYNSENISASLNIMNTSNEWNAVAERYITIKLIPAQKVLIFLIYLQSSKDQIVIGINIFNDSTFQGVSTTTTSLAELYNTFVGVDEKNKNSEYSIINRLQYTIENENNLDIIRKKALKSGSAKSLEFDGLYDCSFVQKGSTITIDNKNYYALNNYTLIEKNS